VRFLLQWLRQSRHCGDMKAAHQQHIPVRTKASHDDQWRRYCRGQNGTICINSEKRIVRLTPAAFPCGVSVELTRKDAAIGLRLWRKLDQARAAIALATGDSQ
jgi:hypothetical protein